MSSPEGLAKLGVRVGSLVIHPDGGPYSYIVLATHDGKVLRGNGALTALFEELKAQQTKDKKK